MEEAIDGAMTRRFELEWAPFWTGTSYFAPYWPVGTTLSLLELAMLSGAIGVLPPVGCPIPSRLAPSCSYLTDMQFVEKLVSFSSGHMRDEKVLQSVNSVKPEEVVISQYDCYMDDPGGFCSVF